MILIKKGRVRVKKKGSLYVLEARLSFWLPFWWYMGSTVYFDVAKDHITWIEENIL